MGRPFRFAPISSAPSTRLGLVIFLFRANAVLGALYLILTLVNLVWHVVNPASFGRTLLNLVILVCWSGANWWIAGQLGARQRRGAIVGLVLFALSLLQTVFFMHRDWLQISVAILSLGALASVWDELTPGEREKEHLGR